VTGAFVWAWIWAGFVTGRWLLRKAVLTDSNYNDLDFENLDMYPKDANKGKGKLQDRPRVTVTEIAPNPPISGWSPAVAAAATAPSTAAETSGTAATDRAKMALDQRLVDEAPAAASPVDPTPRQAPVVPLVTIPTRMAPSSQSIMAPVSPPTFTYSDEESHPVPVYETKQYTDTYEVIRSMLDKADAEVLKEFDDDDDDKASRGLDIKSEPGSYSRAAGTSTEHSSGKAPFRAFTIKKGQGANLQAHIDASSFGHDGVKTAASADEGSMGGWGSGVKTSPGSSPGSSAF